MSSATIRAVAQAAVLALLAAPAWAKEPVDTHTPLTLFPAGMSAQLGGGVVGFTDKALSDITDVGGAWTARLIVGTRTHVGAEAAYLGSAQRINTLGLDDKAYLLSNGVEGNVRLNLTTGIWQPYAVAGVAWRHYSVENTASNTSSVADKEDMAEIPVGVGLAFRYDGFVADARVTFNNALINELLPEASLDNWQAGARLGFEF